MAKKNKAAKIPRQMTKRQLSQFQRHQRRQRLVRLVGVVIIVIALLIVGIGWLTGEYLPMQQAAITVNGLEIPMRLYVDMLKIYSQGETDADLLGFQANQLIRDMEDAALIQQAAAELGYAVTENEVNSLIREEGLPSDAATVYRIKNQLLLQTLLEGYFEEQVPVAAAQVNMNAMLLESQAQANEVAARLVAGAGFGELAAELSLDSFTRAKSGEVGYHTADIIENFLNTAVPGDYAFSLEAGSPPQAVYDEEIRKGVGYWIVKVLTMNGAGDEAHALGIVAGNLVEAEAILARLEAGEEFEAVAAEVSEHDSSREEGGDLGIIYKGLTTPALSEYIFENPGLELGVLSVPLADKTLFTPGGFWLVEVLDNVPSREISQDDRDILKSQALQAWVNSLREDPSNVIDASYLDGDRILWAISKLD